MHFKMSTDIWGQFLNPQELLKPSITKISLKSIVFNFIPVRIKGLLYRVLGQCSLPLDATAFCKVRAHKYRCIHFVCFNQLVPKDATYYKNTSTTLNFVSGLQKFEHFNRIIWYCNIQEIQPWKPLWALHQCGWFTWLPACRLNTTSQSWWPGDAMWQHRSGSTLAQVMTYCLTALSHYLNYCWFIIKGVPWHSLESNFMRSAHEFDP